MALTHKESEEIIKNKSLRAASFRRTATKIIIIVLIAALCLTGGTYGIMTFIEANSMEISIVDKKTGLSLSETSDFSVATTNLDMNGPDVMDAYTYTWLKLDENILGYDGAHHGDNYIAYSFYLKNVNLTSPCLYTMSIELTRNIKNVASALRIMVIENEMDEEARNVAIYAQAKPDGTAEAVAYNLCESYQSALLLEELNNNKEDFLNTNITTPFLEDVVDDYGAELGYFAMRQTGLRLSHDSYKKYTIVIWLEGTDLQCVNTIVGGRCSVNVNFELEEYLDPEYYG